MKISEEGQVDLDGYNGFQLADLFFAGEVGVDVIGWVGEERYEMWCNKIATLFCGAGAVVIPMNSPNRS